MRGVRIVRGRVALRVRGFAGLQHLGASDLVRFVPLSKLRSAAKKLLGKPPRSGGGKRRKGRKAKRRRQ